jgi:hypothetical protein
VSAAWQKLMLRYDLAVRFRCLESSSRGYLGFGDKEAAECELKEFRCWSLVEVRSRRQILVSNTPPIMSLVWKGSPSNRPEGANFVSYVAVSILRIDYGHVFINEPK